MAVYIVLALAEGNHNCVTSNLASIYWCVTLVNPSLTTRKRYYEQIITTNMSIELYPLKLRQGKDRCTGLGGLRIYVQFLCRFVIKIYYFSGLHRSVGISGLYEEILLVSL